MCVRCFASFRTNVGLKMKMLIRRKRECGCYGLVSVYVLREGRRIYDWYVKSYFFRIDWKVPWVVLMNEHLMVWAYYYVLLLFRCSRTEKKTVS